MQDPLVSLIQSMSKSEKRYFKLTASFGFDAAQKQYVQLFEFVEKYGDIDENKLISRYPSINRQQIANLKSHLLRQILSSIRNLQRRDYAEMIIHELLDFAMILHNRGLTKQSLKMLNKAKSMTSSVQNPIYQYLIFDNERKLETYGAQNTDKTYSSHNTAVSERLISNVSTINKCQNLSDFFHAMYMRNGFIKNENEFEYLKSFFQNNIPLIDWKSAGVYEKMYFIQSHVWFYYMAQDFMNYYKYSAKWIRLFDDNPVLKSKEPLEYISGMHNTLNALFLAGKIEKFNKLYDYYLKSEERFEQSNSRQINDNFQYYKYIHLTNSIMLTAEYGKGAELMLEKLQIIEKYAESWSDNRKLVFWYKLACVFFGADLHDRCIHYLNEVTKSPVTEVREDIHCFARVLNLICHYELGNTFHLGYQIKSAYRFLIKMSDLEIVQKEILKFIRRTPMMNKKDINTELIALRHRIADYADRPFVRRPFLYLDILAWIDSKVCGQPIQNIIKAKLKAGPGRKPEG